VLSAFLIASVILAVTPGPGVLYIVTRSLTQGRRFGLASAAGALAPFLTRARGVRALGRYLTGGSFVGLGIYTVARD
jgi:threonine/homoserine/homoserine lactone efflux protein